jgi:hypothetical protein
MKLFFFNPRGWGHSWTLVRARDEEHAREVMAAAPYDSGGPLNAEGTHEVTEDGPAMVLFGDEYSPDTGE